MRTYLDDDFFLHSDLARSLYFDTARPLPVIDYHNHLNPADIAGNRHFETMTEAWIMPDPYKHRAMRVSGVPEEGITGRASDWEKFMNWANTLPGTIGNPLFLWSALELKRLFDVDEVLSAGNAGQIWKHCNQMLRRNEFGAASLLRNHGAEVLVTSDDLLDDLSDHQKASSSRKIRVLPSLRGDTIVDFASPGHKKWFQRLVDSSGADINTLEEYKAAVTSEFERFEQASCRLSDHALDADFEFASADEGEASRVFAIWRRDGALDGRQHATLKNYLLQFLGKEYAHRGWAMQLHIGAQRATSTRLRELAGSKGGFAAIGNSCDMGGLARFFDALEQESALPRIILYTLNPTDNMLMATLAGSFTEEGIPGKIQFGPAWWFNDHLQGISEQLAALCSYGLISHSIGMTTDSRSVFSLLRHEYYRRILCNQVAVWAAEGIMPEDRRVLSELVANICYHNIKNWLNL